MLSLLKKYGFSLLVITIIFILCFMNTKSLPSVPVQNFDKTVHAIMFLGLACVIFFDNTRYLRYPISTIRILLGTFLFPVALGGLIEIMQTFLTTTRTGDWFDFLFDGIGAFVGCIIALLTNYLFLQREPQDA